MLVGGEGERGAARQQVGMVWLGVGHLEKLGEAGRAEGEQQQQLARYEDEGVGLGSRMPAEAGLPSQSLWVHGRLTQGAAGQRGWVARCEQGGQEARKKAALAWLLPDLSSRRAPVPSWAMPNPSAVLSLSRQI